MSDDASEIDTDRLDDLIDGLRVVASDHGCEVGDVASVEADRLFALKTALDLLAPYWSGRQRTLGDALKIAPQRVAYDAENLLRTFGWLADE